jgi:hypothetical protein
MVVSCRGCCCFCCCCRGLQVLAIESCKFSEEAAMQLAEAISQAQALTHASFHHSFATGTQSSPVMAALQSCAALEHLEFVGNHLSCEGYIDAAALIRAAAHLHTVSLRGNKLREIGLQSLCSVLLGQPAVGASFRPTPLVCKYVCRKLLEPSMRASSHGRWASCWQAWAALHPSACTTEQGHAYACITAGQATMCAS